MKADVRRMYALSLVPPENQEYIPQLYIKSDYPFKKASKPIERALENFEKAIKREQLQLSRQRKPIRNLPFSKYQLIKYYKNNDNYIIVQGDKNLGPCILEREYYIYRGCKEHLANRRNYKQITREGAIARLIGLDYILRDWIGKYKTRDEDEGTPPDFTTIGKAEEIYLRRCLSKLRGKLARFRMTAKVHKIPWKLRPIVCCAGTTMNGWSKWLDYWLQKLKASVPSYVKDSQQILDEIAELHLPANALLFTCDANSMYNNIDTDHAIEVISWWLIDMDSRDELPHNFPLEAVLDAMKIIMKNNIFEWGDSCFLQLLGTAMGTSAAVMWATLYYAYHEVHTILPNHGANLLYYRRFIDDIFGVWTGNKTSDWSALCDDIDDFGVLTWDIKEQELSTSVDFLDLTLTISGGKITSKTFQKKMNLYLYIPPASAHPASCIKGTIYGLIRRYYAQNTNYLDCVKMIKLLYRRLLARGWKSDTIRPLVMEACTTIESKIKQSSTTVPPTATCTQDENRLFIHLVFHQDDISRRRIQQLYQQHCGDLFHRSMGIERPTIAYSRPKNIGDMVTKAQLHQAEGRTSTIIMGEHRAELDSA